MATQVRKDKVQVEVEINGQKRVGKTIGELQTLYKDLNRELRQLPINGDDYNRVMEETRKVKKILDEQRVAMRGLRGEAAGLRGIGTTLKSFFQGLGAGIVAGFSLDRVGEFFTSLKNQARELQGINRRYEVVFGEATRIVDEFGSRAAQSMGLSTTEFKNAAAAAGDLLIPMGFTREEAADLTVELLSVSGALSEWTAGQYTSAETSEILTKALLGEREQLKSLGISISESDVQTRLAQKGQKELTGTALEQAKALATLELVTEKSADARSEFAKEGTNIVRQENRIEAAYENRIDQLAKRLAPAYSRVLGFVERLLGVQEQEQIPALERERRALNGSVFAITAYAEGSEDRLKRIQDLQKEYPDFLGNLRAETVTNEQLRDRLEEVNQEYRNKIFLQSQSEKIQQEIEKLNDAYTAQGNIISSISQNLARYIEQGLRGFDPNSQFGFVDIEKLRVDSDIIQTYLLKITAAREGLKRSFSPEDPIYQTILNDLDAAEALLNIQVGTAEESNKRLEQLKKNRDRFVEEFGLQDLLTIENTSTGGSTNKNQDAAKEIASLQETIERLRIDAMEEGLLKRLALIDLEAKQQIAGLKGSADEVAIATQLIEEQRRRRTLQALEEDVDAQQEIRDREAAKQLAKEKADQQKALDQLDLYHQQRIAEITRAVLAEAEAGKFDTKEEAEKEIQRRMLAEMESYLRKRIALLKAYGQDVSALEEELDQINLDKVFKSDDEDPGLDWLKKLEKISDAAQQIVSELYDLQEARAKAAYDEQVKALEKAQKKELSNRNLSEQQREAIEKKYAAKREQIDLEYRRRERQRAITQSIINTALAASQALATPPAPNVPASILAGVLGGIQTAAIASKTYETGGELPVAGKGGKTVGPRHGDGGIKMFDGRTGEYVGEAEGGELMLSRAFVRNNPEWAERALYSSQHLGGARIFEGGGMLTSVSTTPTPDTISKAAAFNDSNIVNELRLMRRDLRSLQLRIGEKESVAIMDMANEYEVARNSTAL